MNKIEFLKKLDKELSILDQEERQQILDFYEERFYSGTVYENKTEIDIISELESPEVIANNVLEEYGINTKHIKTKEERYEGISTSRVVFLVLFDLFIASWLIPTLFSVVLALGASMFSYIGVVHLIITSQTSMDVFLFIFLTGLYILLFIILMFVLDISLFVLKAIINYHLNVFKYRKRDKVRKKLRKISVDEWIKKRKTLSLVRNLSFVVALVFMGYGALRLYTSDDNFFDVYGNNPELTDIHTESFTNEIANNEVWDIEIDSDYLDIEIVSYAGDEILVTHTYDDLNEFEFLIDYDNNVITISNDTNEFFVFDVKFVLKFLGDIDSVKIEVPEDLLLGDVDVSSRMGKVVLSNIDIEDADIRTLNGRIVFEYVNANGDVYLRNSNGEIVVRNSVSSSHEIKIYTSNGNIVIKDSEFKDYDLHSSNGNISLENLNLSNKNGDTLVAETSNGHIDLEEVYVKNVNLDTSNGDIDFYNLDSTFTLESFDADTSNGNVSSNMD